MNGRNMLKWDERLELDVYYVENVSFYMDLKIIFRTILKVIKSNNIALNSIPDLDIERNSKV